MIKPKRSKLPEVIILFVKSLYPQLDGLLSNKIESPSIIIITPPKGFKNKIKLELPNCLSSVADRPAR